LEASQQESYSYFLFNEIEILSFNWADQCDLSITIHSIFLFLNVRWPLPVLYTYFQGVEHYARDEVVIL
jgi:hypothetical protein